MLTRRQFVAGAAAIGAVIALPIPRSLTYEVGHEPWVWMSPTEQDEFRAWMEGHGVDPRWTYRVDVHADHMTVHQYHHHEFDSVLHRASRCGGSHDDVCRTAPFEVTL